ncbi:TrkH family potassium uptake protein [Actinomyces slackii]|uniref:Ktr system potassium uptake protein B n=1 Tax=Actinomyces slackii TaxID=52774 RepID=A0A3S4SMH4_9ACTO|nr:potassium transporter TrkG [Actinomyces slackii]VEG73406.1 Ktr system potassium uptake protein B [Actinomyces slackii]
MAPVPQRSQQSSADRRRPPGKHAPGTTAPTRSRPAGLEEPTTLRSALRSLGLPRRAAQAARFTPARLAITVFAGIIAVVATLLSLPVATVSGQRAPVVDALFTATSAVCVTGLTTVDTASYWSVFGQGVIIAGTAVGGLGIMTMASLLSLAVSRHVGLTQRMLAASENQSRLGDVASLLRAVILTAAGCQAVLMLALLPRFLSHGLDLGHALWYSLFMALSIFNNAGFVIMPEGLAPYATDWGIGVPIVLGTAVGAVGFPVMLDLLRHHRQPRSWSLHTKLTLTTYLGLSAISTVAIGAFEWGNERTYGALSTSGKLLTALINGVNARSSGLSPVPTEHMHETTWFLQDALMLIGGGSASTAGGLKVTTFAVLVLAILAEARGDRDIEAFGRRIPYSAVRLSVAVAFIGASIIGIATLLLLQLTNLTLDRILFEVISAFATVGLSTGITPILPEGAKYVIVVLMFVGRVGTMTAASALAMRQRRRVIRMPEEGPLIG